MSADDLAAALVVLLRKHSVGDTVRWVGRDASYNRDCGRCPQCGRALPHGSVGPAFQGFGWAGVVGIPHTRQELAAACLVDGRRARNAQDLPLGDLVSAARKISSAMRESGWGHWAKCMDAALGEPTEGDQAEIVGQTLELIRHVGPPELRTRPELETLVTSLARYWPQRPEATCR